MPIPRFIACLDAAEQITAAERSAFVIDMATVTSGLFASKGSNPVSNHLTLLGGVASGESDGPES